jgi:hypothetical protein
MNWITIYIKGRGDFREEVKRKLDHSHLNLMPGSIGGAVDSSYTYDMYWVDEDTDLQDLKKAIGAKVIWKYRLQFYGSLEAFIESQHTHDRSGFTKDEQARINSIREKAKDW